MQHRQFMSIMLLLAAFLFIGACSSSDELGSSDETKKEDNSFQRVDKEESIIPETDEPIDIEVVEDEEAPDVEEVPVRVTAPETSGLKETPAVQEEAPVTPQAAPPVAPRSGAMMWSVQLGAFKNESGAFDLVKDLKNKFNQPVYKRYDAATGYYKVTLGSFQSREQAAEFKADVQSRGYPDAFTVEVAR